MPKIKGKNIEDFVTSSFEDLLDVDIKHKIETLYKNIINTNEFEFMFFNYKQDKNRMGFDQFLRILEYIKHKGRQTNKKYKSIISLDAIYSNSKIKENEQEKKMRESYRVSVLGIEQINKYLEMLHLRKNHVIISTLAKMDDQNIEIIKKVKKMENIIDIDDFDIRARLSDELKLTSKELNDIRNLDESTRKDIRFRYKQRISLILFEDSQVSIKLELTSTKQERNINKLEKSYPLYELEIDFTSKKSNPDIKYLNIMFKEITTLIKILQQSNYIIDKTTSNEILSRYADLLGLNKEKIINLEGRKAQSLEIQHVIEQLPDKYAVTDKADGERYFLMIYNNVVFLISYNLAIKNTGIVLPKNKDKFNDTILDGEYIFLQKYNRHLFMAFDCLYNGNKDTRETLKFMERLKNIDEIIEACFIMKGQKGYKYAEYKGSFDVNNILKYHDKEITNFLTSINNDINIDKKFPLIRRKYFIGVYGGKRNEIFKYAELLWKKYIYGALCPYILDGLMFHPLEQKYITSIKESKYFEYKWKPPEKNSIDFYIVFEKSSETGQPIILYDNSRDNIVNGKPYKIVHLYVGRTVRNIEQPMPFQQENNKDIAYLFLEDGEIRDIEGNIIQDNSVVEFYYNNDLSIPDKHRWVPMRTRHDKTESVRRYRKKYGNYYGVANKIWRSIRNPFTMTDIGILANDKSFDKHVDILRNKIDHSIILSERKENIFNAIRTTLAKPIRNFHNWLKSIIIYTYYNPVYENERKLSIFDFDCGKGEEIMKFYYTRIDFYIGINVDNSSIISPTDGAISRYNKLKKSHPNFPRMFFINMDASILFNNDDQKKALGTMTDKNQNLIEQFFPNDPKKITKFDRINCLDIIQKFLINDTAWSNFVENISNILKPGGYMVITCFDADRIMNLFEKDDKFTSYYTNEKGEKKILFEVIKKYEKIENDIVATGTAVDFYNAFENIQEGYYNTKYLVQRKFIEKEFLNKCDMELIETDFYDNQFHIHRNYFLDIVKYEENEKTRNFLQNARSYYDSENEVNKASYKMNGLLRYYIFRRKDKIKNKSSIKMKGGGGNIHNKYEKDHMLHELSDVLDPHKFIRRDNDIEYNDYTFMSAIHDVLSNSDIIPKSINIKDFYNDLELKMIRDVDINLNKINKINKKLVIGHEYSYTEDEQEILDGVNLLILEKQNGSTKISAFGNKNNGNNGNNRNNGNKKNYLSKHSPSILLFKENNKYQPIYKSKILSTIKSKNKKGIKFYGLFNSNTKLIKRLIDASDNSLI